MEAQETESVAVKEEVPPPVVLDAPLAMEAGVCEPTVGESGYEGAEQTVGISEDNAEVAQPKNIAVEGLADEAPLSVNVSMKQDEGFAARVDEYRPEEAVDSEAAAPAMENDADQSGRVAADDGAALSDRGNDVCLLYTSPSPRD